MVEELSFLNFDGCSLEERTFLIHVLSRSSSVNGPSLPWKVPEENLGAVHSTHQSNPYYYHHSHHPNVYINNVTANVNLHAALEGDIPLPPSGTTQYIPPFSLATPSGYHPYVYHTPGPYNNTVTLSISPDSYSIPPLAPISVLRIPQPFLNQPPPPPPPLQIINSVAPPSFLPPPPSSSSFPPPSCSSLPPSSSSLPPSSSSSSSLPPSSSSSSSLPPPSSLPPTSSSSSIPLPSSSSSSHPPPSSSSLPPPSSSVTLDSETEEPTAAKSWASLFHKSASSIDAELTTTSLAEKPTAIIVPYTNGSSSNGDSCSTMTLLPSSSQNHHSSSSLHHSVEDPAFSFLKTYALNHKSHFIKPRGLNNRSNWCFVNAILQALVACPPFFNLIKSLPVEILKEKYSKSILRSLYEFIGEFQPMEKFPKATRKDKSSKKHDESLIGKTLEAASVYKVLLDLSSDNHFKIVEGRQEDAEEFLTFLLNGINDEILALLKMNEGEEKTEEWKEVGHKNKGCVTRRTNLQYSPLAAMVRGQIRSCVTHSNGEPTATLQPFFTLQLDIQSETIRNVSEALLSNFSLEALDGYVCSKTKVEIEASRSLSIEELPPILILHLKRFIYDETSGGGQKLLKSIDFPVDLEISRDILSPTSKLKYQSRQRLYKLFAVVYHNGGEAIKGHYVTDVYHPGLSTWLRCDDANVKCVSESNVLAHSHNSCPYILFYRRGDTMVGFDKSTTITNNNNIKQ